MKNRNLWKPSKFVYLKKKLIASRDPKEVGISSRLGADIVAKEYHDQLPLFAKGKMLDLGCGKVPLFETYKNFVSDNICIDWANSSHKNPYLDLEHNINESLPLSNEEFDTVLLSDVLEHIKEPRALWAEMYRVLKPGGVVILNVPFFYWIHEEPYDYHRYTRYALESMATDVGFKIRLLKPIGGSPEIVADIIAKNIVDLRWIGPGLAKFIQWATAVFVRTTIGGKFSLSSAERFPFGYFMIVEK